MIYVIRFTEVQFSTIMSLYVQHASAIRRLLGHLFHLSFQEILDIDNSRPILVLSKQKFCLVKIKYYKTF